jgi:hypothetical protein
MKRFFVGLLVAGSPVFASGQNFRTNCCDVTNAPKWLTNFKVSDIAAQMERDMGWSIRRVKVVFHDSSQSLQSAANLNFAAEAFFSPARQTVEFGPQKDMGSFIATFRHELAHVISNQKFKGAIPSWLEEGFANYLGSKRKVDYQWLAGQRLPNANEMSHPSSDATGSKMHYQLSTATVEMIASRCNIKDLLMLTTGSKLTNYLETFCKIKDINTAVRDWVKSKG